MGNRRVAQLLHQIEPEGQPVFPQDMIIVQAAPLVFITSAFELNRSGRAVDRRPLGGRGGDSTGGTHPKKNAVGPPGLLDPIDII